MGPTTTSSNEERSGSALPARVHRPPRPTRARGHQTSANERRAIVGVAVLAAIAGAFAPGQPTNFLVSDVVLRGAAAALLCLATSRARRWTWLVLAGLAVVGAPAGVWLGVAGAGLAVGFVTTLLPRRRIFGAIVGACAAQGLLRFTDVGSGRSSLVLVAVAVLPVLGSAYAVSPRRVRKRVHLGLLVAGGLVLAGTVLFGVAVGLAYSSTQRGVKEAKAGLASARDGHGQDAAVQLRNASTSFDEAHAAIDAWWARPAGAVPIVAQQARAIEAVTAEGAAMARTSAGTAEQADIQQLKYTDGRIDVERLRALQGPLAATAASFDHAAKRVAEVKSPWLIGPLRDRVNEFDAELRATLPEVDLAAAAAKSGPDLFGASGARHYLVLFTQPSESRGLGGFVGNWAEVTAIDGRLEITRSGRADDINPAPEQPAHNVTSPPVPADYMQRYQRFQVGRLFQDVTLSPDLPSVAQVAAQIFPQAQTDHIDGVVTVDPYALAALLKFTGSIKIDGFDTPLTADNAADILVKQQYTTLGTNDARKDFLDQASRKTFDALVSGSLPSPKKVADVLGPVVAQRRLAFTPFDADARALLARVHADGSFRPPDGDDFFEVVTSNNANNKIDMFLQRSIDYDAKYDPGNGAVEATMSVTLRNDAPSTGLPPSVIGSNDQGLPPGTNRAFVSIYSPLGLRAAKIDGKEAPLEFQRELGYAVYSTYVEVPSGGSVTIELALFGQLESSGGYRLVVGHQPLVNPDDLKIHVRSGADWEILHTDGLTIDVGGGSASLAAQPQTDVEVEAAMGRP